MRNAFKIIIILFIVWIGNKKLLAQQYYHLSQYNLHQPFINPAAIGSYDLITGALFYKNQWTGLDGAPNTQGFDILFPLPLSNTVGLTLIRDQVGPNVNYDIHFNYAFRLRLAKKERFLSFGVSPTLRINQRDAVPTTDPNDPSFFGTTPWLPMFNFRVGLYYFQPKFYIGFSLPQMLNNDVVDGNGDFRVEHNFNYSTLHFYLHSGVEIPLKDSVLDMNISGLLKQVAGAPLQLDLNLQFTIYKKLGLGLSWRTSNELFAFINFAFNDYIKLAYAYGHNFGSVGQFSKGDHEAFLIFAFGKKEEGTLVTPRF